MKDRTYPLGHFIMKCKECDKVIAQCRCPDKNKLVVYDTCDECKGSTMAVNDKGKTVVIKDGKIIGEQG